LKKQHGRGDGTNPTRRITMENIFISRIKCLENRITKLEAQHGMDIHKLNNTVGHLMLEMELLKPKAKKPRCVPVCGNPFLEP
jgi:hypothetical protein